MALWFSADEHFGSQRALELCKRPFDTVETMDAHMVKQWNLHVLSSDTTYVLGDFGTYARMSKLNGRIVLLLGNYELRDIQQKFGGDFERFKDFIHAIKEDVEIISNPRLLDFSDLFTEQIYWVCHEPLDMHRKYFNLFGHIHGTQMVKKHGLNVGVDCHHFRPIDLYTIQFYQDAIESKYDLNVFCDELTLTKNN